MYLSDFCPFFISFIQITNFSYKSNQIVLLSPLFISIKLIYFYTLTDTLKPYFFLFITKPRKCFRVKLNRTKKNSNNQIEIGLFVANTHCQSKYINIPKTKTKNEVEEDD